MQKIKNQIILILLLNKKDHEEDLIRLRGFRPIDDTFMRVLFRDKLPLAEYVLRVIIGKDDLRLTKDCRFLQRLGQGLADQLTSKFPDCHSYFGK